MTKLLIVDDNEQNLYMLQVLLEGHGYEVVTAANGAEALEMARRDPPDMIIADILMPVMDGFTLCREWKKDEVLKAIPLVFHTATYTDSKDEEFALSLGAERFILKPVEPDVFVGMLRDIIREAEEGRLVAPREPIEEEPVYLKEYSERLVNKLEEQVFELQEARRALERDITERKRVEEALRESEEKYRNLFENARDVIVTFDLKGNVTSVNQAIAEYGFKEDEFVGKNMRKFVSKKYWPRLLKELAKIARGNPIEGEIELTTPKGEKITDYRSNPIRRGKKVVGFQTILRDITERKRAEEALKEYSERLEEMVEERTKELRDAQEQLIRREKLAVIGQLGASMCHELRNPLGVINNSVYYLKMKLRDVDEKAKKHLKIMEREIASSNKIVSDLLSFAEGKKPTLQKTQINTIVQDALSRTTVPDKVAAITDLGGDLPPLMADPDQIEQVFINLILNAVQAMPNGGRLEINTREREGFIEVECKDTGCGIPEEDLGRLFEPLFTTKARGIGLGLAVSKKIIEAHGGSIEVESEVGKGTTFRVRLPMLIS